MSENTDMVYMEKGEDGVAVVYLNQPKKKNAINATMMDLLTDCFHAADEDPEVRAIVLRGSGNCFTSGGVMISPGTQMGMPGGYLMMKLPAISPLASDQRICRLGR